MTILMFLTPKVDVSYVESDYTVRQAVEKFFVHKYSAVPVLDKEGHYIRNITDGDIFRYIIEEQKLNINDYNSANILKITENRAYKAINYNASMEDLFDLINDQNYVPVVDNNNIFIGIITRKKVINYLRNLNK